jgi:hypothetical protein
VYHYASRFYVKALQKRKQKIKNIIILFWRAMPRADDDDVDFECTGDSGGGTLDNNDGGNYPALGQGASQDNAAADHDDDDPVDNDDEEDDEEHIEDGEYDDDYHDDNELQNNGFDGTGICFATSCKADPSHGCFNSTKQKLCGH